MSPSLSAVLMSPLFFNSCLTLSWYLVAIAVSKLLSGETSAGKMLYTHLKSLKCLPCQWICLFWREDHLTCRLSSILPWIFLSARTAFWHLPCIHPCFWGQPARFRELLWPSRVLLFSEASRYIPNWPSTHPKQTQLLTSRALEFPFISY